MLSAADNIADHPKVATESREDIFYLKEQLLLAGKRAADAKVATDGIVPTPAKTAAVQERLNDFVNQVFALASANICINGIPYEEAMKQVNDFEPFDEGLHNATDATIAARNAARSRVAHMRKTIPAQAVEVEEQRLSAMFQTMPPPPTQSQDSKDLAIIAGTAAQQFAIALDSKAIAERLERSAPELAEICATSVNALAELKNTLKETEEKWVRANTVMDSIGVPQHVEPSAMSLDKPAPAPVIKSVPITPRRARKGLVTRLQTGVKASESH